MDSTPAHRLMAGQRVRIEGPGVVTGVEFDEVGETVDVLWRPDGQQKVLRATLPDGHPVKHAD
ncbi:hypothetical protein L3Q65_00695 (plasmid) [Amycolatopsis sp. FU40]|uniref:hypothetical protein n=1 Tax=Amycolatopsis sp. FU40 TaxID=2914159 RepID=UPI001F41BC07|nr:hypothetical protein [Amycolatopsis sp. FU40]UKD50845.1 hypothetical protein L3Q65_00695 [Amycolatopsis sp. FU40]